jgi:hypothetical protein
VVTQLVAFRVVLISTVNELVLGIINVYPYPVMSPNCITLVLAISLCAS